MVAVIPNRRRGGAHGRTRGQQEIRLRDEARRCARPSGTRDEQAGGHGTLWHRQPDVSETVVPGLSSRRAGGAAPEAQGQAEGREIQTETGSHARTAPRGGERVSQGEGRVSGKSPRPAGVEPYGEKPLRLTPVSIMRLSKPHLPTFCPHSRAPASHPCAPTARPDHHRKGRRTRPTSWPRSCAPTAVARPSRSRPL